VNLRHPGSDDYNLYPSKSVIDDEKLHQNVKQICRYVEKAVRRTLLSAQGVYTQESYILILHHLYRSFKSDSENAYRLTEIKLDT
jgi:hypothetical protein